MNRTDPGANLAALRDHNTAVVLGLLRCAGPAGASRSELAARAGLTPQAVSKITGRLRDAGLAAEAGRRASTGGKPATALCLVPGAAHAVGVHLDRDALTVTLVDLTGTETATRTAPLDFGAGAEAVLDAVAGAVSALLADHATGDVLGAGVAVPGPLDHRSGVLHRVTGFPRWDGFPLRDALGERLGLPVVVDKDTNAAALGLALRAPRATGSFAYLHLGTGLGAGLVLDGGVHRGPRTGAGEFGHQVVMVDGPQCACGDRGCLEALCLAAVAEGDTTRAARLLGVGALNLVRLLDIDGVLLGGGVVLARPTAFVDGVRDALGGAVPVDVAPEGARVVVGGAAELVLAPLFGA
ncbi:transcriptional regulator [Streptomyces mobaraensis NBRC 13819 = DSM 40847]|uniref:Transcriptional regulator n=1 Tax=Streptomyces mobaraensis (strain ATCC 29032 / DSM 40847 / JCM 4168 / NBRC 13819 / NCIMB 11159 / IPCR 16-22) TaxID=1223523 RepID=M3BG96_STRM1|nr:ROK family transcriptional regulator [Streptomyces mobaraensis]EME98614.1 transcriptional regulator [Streptomyces mobaraensis NBRC 13819 = DSM 40847]